MHQSAQLARPDAGDPRAAGGARRVGDERSRTAAVAAAAHRRRHAGTRRGGGVAEACDAGAAACGERCGGARRLDRSAAAGARMAGAGAAGRCGRQRDRRHPAARHRRAARHVHRLESVPRPAARRANWPIATAPIWHLPRHVPNASVPAIRALRSRSAIRRTMPISPACRRWSARCSAIACCSTTTRRLI